MLRLAVLLAVLPFGAVAGPWPREMGEWFVSGSTEVRGFDLTEDENDLGHYSSLYFEYGLTRSLTIGLHVGHGATADTDARAFARLPVYHRGARRVALELSVGQVGDTTYSGIGLQYGRGFQALGRNGWFTVEGRLDHAIGAGLDAVEKRQTKLDVTLGMTHPNGLKTMAQVFTTTMGDDVFTTFAPGIVVPVGRNLRIETGLLFDLEDTGPPGLKIGFWQEF